MDRLLRRSAWLLASGQLREMPTSSLRTAFVVVEADADAVDVMLHCKHGFGFDFAYLGGELLARHPASSLPSRVAELAASTSPLVLFLGAGFSASSRVPMGNSLRDSAIRRLLGGPSVVPDETSSIELARRFHELIAGSLTGNEAQQDVAEFSRMLSFERVLRVEKQRYPSMPTLKELRVLEADVLASPGPAVQFLHQLLESDRKLILITVNLDRLIEHGQEARTKVFASDTDFENALSYLDSYLAGAETSVPVFKLHGSIEDFDTCVVTDDVTGQSVSGGKLQLLQGLVGTTSPRPWVYIGASMRDLDLLPHFKSPGFMQSTQEFWVMPHLIETVQEIAHTRHQVWAVRPGFSDIQDHLITETADAFLESLAGYWN